MQECLLMHFQQVHWHPFLSNAIEGNAGVVQAQSSLSFLRYEQVSIILLVIIFVFSFRGDGWWGSKMSKMILTDVLEQFWVP